MKVLVGLSGGVDSAVAAWKLMQEGHDVTCCFMRNWDSLTNADIEGNPDLTNDICPQEQDYNDARAVADHLGLKLLRADFIQEYWDHVFQTFLKEYERGRTPNPDILCNKYIKFDSFFDFATSQGFEAVATGHYANNRQEDGFVWLTRAQDRNKDQTYFLCQVPENKIARTLFPIGGLTKPEVRRIAEALRLESVASKKDSTGICFIGERNFRLFLSNYLPMKPGPIVDIDSGNVLGEHQWVLYYTVGQRKGLNITAHKGPWFVAGKDVSRNELYVCHVDHQDWLLSDACLVEDINWIVPDDWNIPEKLTAKFRYRQPDQEVQVTCLDKTTALVKYPQGIRSVTAGQEAVFYDGDRCLGGGTIEEVFWNGRSVQQTIAAALNRSDASGYPDPNGNSPEPEETHA